MKKRIIPLIIILLLTTGCTCEYNLTIDGNTYKEKITIIGENSEEITSFNNNWQISINKEDNNTPGDPESNPENDGNIYKYNLSGDKLTFNYDFIGNEFANSMAVSNCYDKLTITNYNQTTIISTSPKAKCYEENPPLTNVKVTIKVDRKVISNNADSISGNTYIWNITKENASSKSINLVLDNNKENTLSSSQMENNEITSKKNDYTICIFLIIIVLIIFLGYKWFMKFKDKNNNID